MDFQTTTFTFDGTTLFLLNLRLLYLFAMHTVHWWKYGNDYYLPRALIMLWFMYKYYVPIAKKQIKSFYE